jgi:hypothetical protein
MKSESSASSARIPHPDESNTTLVLGLCQGGGSNAVVFGDYEFRGVGLDSRLETNV